MSLYDVINKDKNIEPYSYEEFSRKLMIMGRNQRFSWLLSNVMEYDLTDKQYWDSVRMGYQGSELGHLHYMDFEDIMFLLTGMFGDYKNGVKFFMDQEEQEFLKNLDDEVSIYRGVYVDEDQELELVDKRIGISWSLDKEKGEWFGNRFQSSKRTGYLLETKIEKRFILFYINDMKENEVILDPNFIREKVKITNLKTNEVSYEKITEG